MWGGDTSGEVNVAHTITQRVVTSVEVTVGKSVKTFGKILLVVHREVIVVVVCTGSLLVLENNAESVC